MFCRKIIYRNFRNIEYAELEPSETVTVLNGRNGQGKTNLLEGVYLFAGVRSFRSARENEFVRFGAELAELSQCPVYLALSVKNRYFDPCGY